MDEKQFVEILKKSNKKSPKVEFLQTYCKNTLQSSDSMIGYIQTDSAFELCHMIDKCDEIIGTHQALLDVVGSDVSKDIEPTIKKSTAMFINLREIIIKQYTECIEDYDKSLEECKKLKKQ